LIPTGPGVADEQNLANLIVDVRKGWNTPQLPVSVTTSGFMSPDEATLEAQSRVSVIVFVTRDCSPHATASFPLSLFTVEV
jgi:hypothetical protein